MKDIKIDVEVIKVQVGTKAELTCKLLTQPVGEGIRLSNQEITDEIVKAFGSGSINCVRWYSSKISQGQYVEKYGLDPDNLDLTPRKIKK